MLFAFNRKKRRKGRKSRRRGRNSWRGASRRHARAARRGWRGRRRGRNGRRRGRNGMSLSGVTAGFNAGLLSKAAVAVGGALANNMLSGTLAKLIPVSFLKTGPGSYVTSLLSAGLVGVGAKMVVPQYAGQLFFGAVLDVVSRVATKYIVPLLPGPRMAGMSLANYFTGKDAAFMMSPAAYRLDGLGYDDDGMDGMDNYLATRDLGPALQSQALANLSLSVDGDELDTM